jgi:hypothetical protein
LDGRVVCTGPPAGVGRPGSVISFLCVRHGDETGAAAHDRRNPPVCCVATSRFREARVSWAFIPETPQISKFETKQKLVDKA